MEKDPLVNRFISVPRDKGSLNCAVFVAGIVEAVLCGTGFVCKIKCFVGKMSNVIFVLACQSNSSLAQRYYLHGQV